MRARHVHPWLVAAYPLSFLYAHNIGHVALWEYLQPLLGTLALATVLWWALGRAWRGHAHGADAAAWCTSWLMLAFFTYGHLFSFTTTLNAWMPGWPLVFTGLWLLAAAAGVRGVTRYAARLAPLHLPLALTFGVLLLPMLWTTVTTEYTRLVREEALSRLYRPLRPSLSQQIERPDIYYIILDSYAGEENLRTNFRYDNRPFLAGLRQRGFYVVDGACSNYGQTVLSLPSSLNYSYLDETAAIMGADSNDRRPLEALVADSRVVRTLRSHGYRIIAFPSDYEPIAMPSDIPVMRMGGYSNFTAAIFKTTPVLLSSLMQGPAAFDPYAVHRAHILYQLAQVPRSTRFPGPHFVFAHILAPHQPLVFDAQGRPVKVESGVAFTPGRPSSIEERRQRYVRRYCDELTYLNTRVLGMVDQIRRTATRPTVIILQGDHGPGFLPNTNENLAYYNMPERFGILNAIALPQGRTAPFYPGMTPVNSFRILFNTCFKTHYRILPDHSYFSSYTRPYDFIEVTDTVRDKRYAHAHPH